MTVTLNDVGKKYLSEWIFKNLSAQFKSGEKWAITGPNGSGKSTLLKVISGHLSPTSGNLAFDGDISENVSICAPYIELIEAFTALEMINFQRIFIPFQNNLSAQSIEEILQLNLRQTKPISEFSSGMKQRFKLGLSLLSTKSIILLDEPTTNLDEISKQWYQNIINDFGKEKLIIVASNDKTDYSFCQHSIHIPDYKIASRVQKSL
jgi:ABC-type multidrug transport system ATPase subunit